MIGFALSDKFWSPVVAAWLLLMLVIGGVSNPSPKMIVVHTILALMMLAAATWRLRHGFPSRLGAAGVLLALLAFALVGLQLIPLPPSVWQHLPGRDIVVETARLAGASVDGWRPLSLAPDNTKLAFLGALPAFATFLAVMTFDRRDTPLLGLSLVIAAVVGVLLGLLQRNAPVDSWLHFYGYRAGLTRVSGTFGNPNYFAAQLFTSIPFLAALAMTMQDKLNMRGWLVFLFVAAYAGIILAGLAVVGSRGGVVFAMISVLLSVALVYRTRAAGQKRKRSVLPFVVIGSLLIFGQLGMAGILQLASTDPLADYRTTIYRVSLETMRSVFPWGGGFGSFVPLYQMFESPGTMISNYVNHAHNDWLEIVIEGGLPAAVLLGVFLLLVLASLVSVLQMAMDNSSNGYYRAAAVALLLLLMHAIIDFGLRTPALGAIAAACFGLLLTARRRSREFETTRRTAAPSAATVKGPIRPFSRPARGFAPAGNPPPPESSPS
jgi:O-antigen ligase